MSGFVSRIVRVQVPIWLMTPLLGLMLVLGFGGGYMSALKLTNPCPLASETCASFNNFWKAWDLVSKNYVDPQAVVPQEMIDGAISGMIDSLGDRGHTRYLSAEMAKSEREALEGRFEGIGAYIDVRDDQPIIIQPIENSPAERAGIRPGDLIMKVDGNDMRGVTVDELRLRVRGPKGTSVVLTVLHEGATDPVDITVVRDEIKLPAVSWTMLENRVALIRLNQFAFNATTEMQQALTQAQAQGATAIVLDLRNNPGGLVDQLIGVASQFLPPDTIVLLEQDRSGNRTPYKTRSSDTRTELPLVVLVNGNSASSAEILAGALQEAGRARVIGVSTFGTATVLRSFGMDGGAELRIGTTQWLTPKGEVVRGKGIRPDEIVALPPGVQPLSPSDAGKMDITRLLASEDAQLNRALQIVQAARQ